MESKLINYEIFINKRPDMEVHTETSIISCINSAYVLLDGECASLISRVESFNYNQNGLIPDRDTKDDLYRNDFELNQLQEALVFQVQYVLNMGNDFTIGGGSYSIGNVNSSYNRPEGRELIAPGVYKLLSNARVYNLNAFGSFNQQDKNHIPLSTSKEILERVNKEYVSINQPTAQAGQVAYVNQSNQVDFGNPEDLQITTYNTQRIAGPEGYRTSFYKIDEVPNIAFFGNDMGGTFSAVHRQELVDKLNDKYNQYFTKEEVLNIVYASGSVWRSDFQYKVDYIVQIVNGVNDLEWFLCLKDNININPLTNPRANEYWKRLEAQEIDLNIIVEQLKPYIDTKLQPLVSNEVQQQLNTLPTANYIQETKNQVLSFDNQADFESYKQANNLTNADFQDITLPPVEVDLSNVAKLNTNNTFRGDNFFQSKVFVLEPRSNNEATSKSYVDNAISPINSEVANVKNNVSNLGNRTANLESQNLNTRLSTLENYCKTGIIQFVVWNQNGFKIRLIPILTPPNLVGRENELLDRIHVSTTTTHFPPNSSNTNYQEWDGGENVEILNPRMNTDIEVRSLNTNNFRNNNISMNLYTWWDLNQNLATTLNGDWSPKLIIPITSRYDRTGITLYFVYRAK